MCDKCDELEKQLMASVERILGDDAKRTVEGFAAGRLHEDFGEDNEVVLYSSVTMAFALIRDLRVEVEALRKANEMLMLNL